MKNKQAVIEIKQIVEKRLNQKARMIQPEGTIPTPIESSKAAVSPEGLSGTQIDISIIYSKITKQSEKARRWNRKTNKDPFIFNINRRNITIIIVIAEGIRRYELINLS